MAGKVDAVFINIGDHDLKNIAKSLEVWAWPPAEASKLRRTPTRWRWISGATAFAVTATLATYFAFQDPPAPELPTGARIALIPFKNVGDNPDDAFFSEGLRRAGLDVPPEIQNG